MTLNHLRHTKCKKTQFVYLGDNSTHEIIGQGKVSIKLNDGNIKKSD
jgi:hypothetical protein